MQKLLLLLLLLLFIYAFVRGNPHLKKSR